MTVLSFSPLFRNTLTPSPRKKMCAERLPRAWRQFALLKISIENICARRIANGDHRHAVELLRDRKFRAYFCAVEAAHLMRHQTQRDRFQHQRHARHTGIVLRKAIGAAVVTEILIRQREQQQWRTPHPNLIRFRETGKRTLPRHRIRKLVPHEITPRLVAIA